MVLSFVYLVFVSLLRLVVAVVVRSLRRPPNLQERPEHLLGDLAVPTT
jgi:hypothetical protein